MRWRYEVQPARIEGEVRAADEESASQAAADDAMSKAYGAVEKGTWDLRQVSDD